MKSGRGGIKYEDLVLGDGALAARGCRVEIRYDLFLNRGERVQEQQRDSFRLGDRRVIPGLAYGIEGMREGGRRRIRAGPSLAYGEQGVPGVVPSNAVLEFHVSLLRVESAGQDPAQPTFPG